MAITSKLRFKSFEVGSSPISGQVGLRDTTKAGHTLMFCTKLSRCNSETVAHYQAHNTYAW